jgi:hypothetical protein
MSYWVQYSAWNGILHFCHFLHTLCIQTDHSETSPLINRSINAATMTTINPFHEPLLHNSTWAFLITSAAAYFNPFVFRCWNSYLITVICSLCSCCDSFTRADRPYLVHYMLPQHCIPYLIHFSECTPYTFAVLSLCTEYEFMIWHTIHSRSPHSR